MSFIFEYFGIYALILIGAFVFYWVFKRFPTGPVIYLFQSNGVNFSFPLIPTIFFLVIVIGFLYFFLS